MPRVSSPQGNVLQGDEMTGEKFDTGKPRWSLLPRGSIAAILRVLEYGARKYAEGGWAHVPDARRRYYDAAQRHLEAWWCGTETDPESGEPHLAHAACCILFLLADSTHAKGGSESTALLQVSEDTEIDWHKTTSPTDAIAEAVRLAREIKRDHP